MSSLQSLHVLLVDDNQHMRAITSAVLQSAGVRKVREASDGAAGLEILRQQSIDLAIVDFNMFPLDGPLCHKMRFSWMRRISWSS
jgi:DNA-binding response OmpR family regulator